MATSANSAENQKNQRPGRGGKRPGAGRPSGVGNRATPEDKRTLTELAKMHAPAALKVLVDVAMDPRAPHSARISAASSLLDRSHGRPVQQLEHSGKNGGPILTATIGPEATMALEEASAYLGRLSSPGEAPRPTEGHSGNGQVH